MAELANVAAGYYNGVVAGHHWDGVAVGDRLLLAASFVLVGYMSVKTQEYAREAGVSIGRMRQIDVEKALRVAIGRVRETLNVELVQRAVARESVALLGASKAILILRETPFGTPLTLSYSRGGPGYLGRAPAALDRDCLASRARRRGRRRGLRDRKRRLGPAHARRAGSVGGARHVDFRQRIVGIRARSNAPTPANHSSPTRPRRFAPLLRRREWRSNRPGCLPSSASATTRLPGKRTSSPTAAT